MTRERDVEMSPQRLPTAWRDRAGQLRHWGMEREARLWECAAEELEAALRSEGAELLTLQDAALVSGYTPDHIGRLVRDGKVANHGRPNAPRVRRADLPRKTGGLHAAVPPNHISRAERARAVVNRQAGGAR
jgi:hypothetical protein